MLYHIDSGSNTAKCQNVHYETQINLYGKSFSLHARNVHPDHTSEKMMKKIMVCFCKVKTIQSQNYIMTTIFLYDIILNRIF